MTDSLDLRAVPRVLVVDDDPMIRFLVREALEQVRFDVAEVEDGEQALVRFQSCEPDLVLLDVELPGIDGFEVCRRMRGVADPAHLPIVMVTGLDDTESIRRAYEAGATDFISKPLNLPVLGYRARYVLRSAHTLRSLHAAQRRNAAMLEAIPDAIFRLNAEGVILDFKPESGGVVYARHEDVVGRRIVELVPPAASMLLSQAFARTEDNRQSRSFTFEATTGYAKRHYEATLVRVGSDECLVLLRDVTCREEAAVRMREALVVFEACSQGIMTTDREGVITAINPALCHITGYAGDEVVGRKPSLFKSNRHDAAFYAGMWRALLETGVWEGEIWNRRKNGDVYPQWQSISAVRDSTGRIIEFVALCSDITQRKHQEEAMWRQANFDPLTGLANRNLLHDRLERCFAQARRNEKKIGLMFIDLDGFKWINDTLGHDVGDELLIQVARRLKSCIREEDTAARLGGDEFTLVIQDVAEVEDLLAVGEKVVSILREPFILAGSPHHLSGSVGITVFPDDGDKVQTLFKNADIAMYKAKEAGKNRHQFYAQHMQADAMTRMRLIADLHVAIEEQAFVLYYQPIVDAVSGRLVGGEALIRWQHPRQGIVSPQDFIPVAEDCGLIVDIGEWALREAARQWREWQDRGYPALRLAVNVSSVQYREDGLPAVVRTALEEYGVDPACLMLEITESALMGSDRASEARMRDIKGQGVGYALDDFGTGFSSLSYLKRFPVDIVKVDRSFVSDCPGDRNDARLVEAIINMAHSLELRVTAEGVENEAQIDFLRELGCDYLQGWYVGKPMLPAEFERLMRQGVLIPPAGAGRDARLLAAPG